MIILGQLCDNYMTMQALGAGVTLGTNCLGGYQALS